MSAWARLLGFAKSTLCKWLKQEQYERPKMSGEVLELDGAWTRVAGGNVELKVARDEPALRWRLREAGKAR